MLQASRSDPLLDRLEGVRARIARAARRAGRDPARVGIVAVTKYASLEAIRALLALGHHDVGENRVQQALERIAALGPGPVWHLVGHLQRNKARRAAASFAWIHSVDSLALLQRLDALAREGVGRPRLLVQVNTTAEPQKHGVPPEELRAFLGEASRCEAVTLVGLMTLAREDPDPEAARPAFRTLAELRAEANRSGWYRAPLEHLSMGMSQDFEVAVEEGATWVRLGSVLFRPEEGSAA